MTERFGTEKLGEERQKDGGDNALTERVEGVGLSYITSVMHPDTAKYNKTMASPEREICELLAQEIDRTLSEAENRIWHAHPVWFLEGNPVVGYSKLKDCVRLLFWSGQSFEEETLKKEGTFKAAEVRYTCAEQVNRRRPATQLFETDSGKTGALVLAADDSNLIVIKNEPQTDYHGTA